MESEMEKPQTDLFLKVSDALSFGAKSTRLSTKPFGMETD